MSIKKTKKIVLRVLGYIVLSLLLIVLLLSLPIVQNRIATYATKKINTEFGTDLKIKKVNLSFLGSVQLKGIEIRDHHKDTLIFVSKLSTSLSNAKKVIDGEVKLKNISLEGAHLYMKTYKNEEDDNLTIFIDNFDNGLPKDSLATPFILATSKIDLNDLSFKLINENKENPLQFEVKKASGNIQDFSIVGPNVSLKTRNFHFVDNRGLKISNLTTDFTYSLTEMFFKNTKIQTQNSDIQSNIHFIYKRKDLSDFNNKVQIEATFGKSKLSVRDLKKIYSELNGEDILVFTGMAQGTLNNFTIKSLNLHSDKGLKILGDFSFLNTLKNSEEFVFTGNLKNISSDYKRLRRILPNLLGEVFPTELDRLGKFLLKGFVRATQNQINASVSIDSEIGSTISDLQITDINLIDNAKYNGKIELKNLDIGVLFNDPLFGEISLKGDINGKGFKLENINTSFIGIISKFGFKEYNYTNIAANGQYQNYKFDGHLTIDDPNFKMNFNGLADLSSKTHRFDFKSDIAFLDLKQTHLFTRDSISKLKGNIQLDIEGNTFDDIIGKATFKDIIYTNEKSTYSFKQFNVVSSLKDSIKTIKVDSKDIANGYLKGKFAFSELLPVAQNALGSIYTNYTPYKVTPNQFLDFNFTVYNQIVNVFFSSIFIDNNTKIKGKIKSNKNQLKLSISSPKISVYKNEFKDVLLRADNQNPLYNAHLTAARVNTKYYNVSKLNLLNRTENDTLQFKSVFKGGKEKNEDFNLDFFYTINPEGKSVVGFQKSSFKFKENIWNINPETKNSNKVTFNLKTNDFYFSPFKLKSQEQEIEFLGELKGTDEKALSANFTTVNLTSFLPKIDSLALKGRLSGKIDFIQNKGLYAPEGVLSIENFQVNDFKQGDLNLIVKGENSYKKYAVDLSLNNQKAKSISATGFLDFSTKKSLIDLTIFLEDFGLNAFSPLGQDVLSSIRGSASGDFTLRGFLGNPDMEGTLILKDAGLKFPYLNTDYNFENESIITLQEQSFFLEGIQLKDSKHSTKGKLRGRISHSNFKFWELEIDINADKLLVLNTQNTEEALYYGTAFLTGNASITGLTDQLDIDVYGKTEKGTVFVVPLKDVETVNNYNLIHFKSDTTAIETQEKSAIQALKGLSLNIDLEVTKDATAQVVIDEVYGSQLSGNGLGNLQIQINTRGKFNIFGDYKIDKGVYDFKYGGFINKPFVIQKGGTVSWNGDPYKANLDVAAIYKTKANPGVLLQNFNSNRNIEIDLVTKITGGLFNSKQELDIRLPNVDPSIASELEFILNDNNENQKTTQFISLLAFGGFTNPDRINFNANTTIANTASSAISTAFSSLLNNPDSKFQLGVDYRQGQRDNDLERLNTDNQVDVSIKTKVSDRVAINGKVGVPVGTKTQSSVVGEVKVEVLLNKEGTFKALIFNRQNEIQYSTEEEGYTQGLGLSYQVNFNTLSGLLKKIGARKKQKKKASNTIKKDSIKSPHKTLINFEGN